MVMVNAGLTVRVIVADAKLLPVSVARNVMLLAPDAVGVPVIAPVEGLSESPACSVPEVIVHVYPPGNPPVATNVWL